MKGFPVAFLAAVVLAGTPALATDTAVRVTLDGRPFDTHQGSVAVKRGNVVYADVVDLTKAFNGLLTFSGKGTVKILVGGRVGTFTVGSRTLFLGSDPFVMPGAPFRKEGDIFVPLDAFVTQVAAEKLTMNAKKTRADIAVSVGTPAK